LKKKARDRTEGEKALMAEGEGGTWKAHTIWALTRKDTYFAGGGSGGDERRMIENQKRKNTF